VNGKAASWKAGHNEVWKEFQSLEHAKKLLGWKPSGKTVNKAKIIVQDSLPENFNSATQWPKCNTIGTIYNQARCGYY